MKPVRKTDSASQSCSCTSCLYKSESEQPSIRKYVAHGSKIDRLYYGKYIPLRERKLLNRLVRTRAVYDDLRARLISDSTLSLEKNADLRPGKHHRAIKPLDTEKSGAILEIVNIIDKGLPLDPKKLSECCSCCSCSSKLKKSDQMKKVHRRKRAFARTYEGEYGESGETGTGEGVYARTYEKEYGKILPDRMGERYNKRGVRFKAKHIRSDPCTCTFKFSGLIKKHSKDMFRNIRPLPLDEPFLVAEDQYIRKKNKKRNLARRSIQKYKELQGKLEQDMKKLNESKENIKQNLQLHAKKSLVQAKQLKHKIKQNIESGVRRSIQAVKALNPKDKTFESIEYPEIETTFKIKKDSIVKFKDYLKRKQVMKDWECDFECKPDVCIPEECFKILKLKRVHKPKRQQDRKHITRYELINREVKVGGIPISRSSSSVQTGHYAITSETQMKKQKPMLRDEGKNRYTGNRVILESKEKKVGVKKGAKKVSGKSEASSVMPAALSDKETLNIMNKDRIPLKKEALKETELRLAKKDKTRSRGRQAVRIKSSFSFEMEFYKNPPDAKSSRPSQPSGIHMHAPRRKRRNVHRHPIKQTVLKPSAESSQSTPDRHRSRLIQTDKYDHVSITSPQGQLKSVSQCECEKHHNNVKTNTNYEIKSASSLTNESMLSKADKNVLMEVKQNERLSQVSLLPVRADTLTSGINKSYSNHNQAVRIGSTFSFNIEFYKKNSRNELKTPSIKENIKQTRIENRYLTRKLVQVKGTSAKAYHQAKTTFRRCFCTLKLNGHKKHKNKKIKSSTTATVTCICETKATLPSVTDKYVETKNNYRKAPKVYHLLPYECEPGVCVPGDCDPTVCKKMLDIRKGTQKTNKSIGSYTGSRKTKSTSSIVSRPFNAAKAKVVQSTIVPTKTVRTSVSRKYKDKLYVGRNELFKINKKASERQAVRVGSSFSFNIEFYKDKQTAGIAIAKKPSLSAVTKEIKQKQGQLKDNGRLDFKNKNKTMLTRVKTIDKNIGPSFKRCFCTLKLYRNKNSKNKTFHNSNKVTANTQTIREIPMGENKSTKTKRERHYRVLPYECEPYVCVPGECDPYICLQKIRKRELNTREVSVFTDKAEMRSMSSLTENSLQSEATLVQPKLYQKGTNMKTKYVKPFDSKQVPTGKTIKAANSKQAVRIGSNFNFSIEFSKQLPAKYLNDKQFQKVNPIKDRDKRITVTKLRVDHVDTQVLQPRKVNRASLVRPMLKRCFCTLNLQSKIKQHQKDLGPNNFGPKVYNVGRALTTKTDLMARRFSSQINAEMQLYEHKNKIISISTSSFLLNKYVKRLKSGHDTLKLFPSWNTSIHLKQPLIIKSNLSLKVNIIRQLSSYPESRLYNINHQLETSSSTFMNEMSLECPKLCSQPLDSNFNKIPDLNRYLDRCFCTMNVQILNQQRINRINKKLKPYECEPGICIPGECDPYECKMLIMKRFAKHLQKNSGTNSISKSFSSYATSNTELDPRRAQMQTYAKRHSQKSIPQKYKPQRQHEQKQAVRIMSSYSFNLEFHKNLVQPFHKQKRIEEETDNFIRKPLNPNALKTVNIGTQGKKIRHKEIKFEPAVMLVDRATAPEPMPKRCFCTLKLQKRGKIHRENTIIHTKPTVVSRSVKVGTNIKYREIPIDSNHLKFYECEPGICIPGQCDPYKCLDLMKKRKDLGINTIRMARDSDNYMKNESKGKYKTRAIDAIPIRPNYTSKNAMKHKKNSINNSPHVSSRGSRQVVRIGSNFSFNIDFFKDKPNQQLYDQINLQRQNIRRNEIMQIMPRKKVKTPSRKSVSLKVAGIEKPLKGHFKADQHNNKTFKDKCYCLLGLKNKNKKNIQRSGKTVLETNNKQNKRPDALQNKQHKNYQTSKKIYKRGRANARAAEKPILTDNKPPNTNFKPSNYLKTIEPYECEPGICIPDQCDPYLCEKIIRQRMAKKHSKRSNTESVRTSITSTSDNYKQSKNERVQVSAQKRQQYKILPSSDKMMFNADKPLVRIGSNFSFNVEFYKENVNGSGDDDKIREVRKYTSKKGDHVSTQRNIAKSVGTATSTKLGERSNQSQVKKIGSKTLGLNPLLKRCFCTLKLINKPIKQIDKTKKDNRLDTKPIKPTKSVETQISMRLKDQPFIRNGLGGKVLSPYECEPFVCVPGKCNPVECLKLIQKRQQVTKDFGTVTEYPKRKSIGNVTTRTKDRNLQVKHPDIIPNVQKKYLEKSVAEVSDIQPRQAVRIGSNFSFNIEFFRDMGNSLPTIDPQRPLEDLNTFKYSRKILQHHIKSQPSHFKHDVDPQVISKKHETTGTAMAHLKQCLCALTLRNQKNNQQGAESNKMLNNQETTGTATAHLKQCFCTLPLRNQKNNQKGVRSNKILNNQDTTGTAMAHLKQCFCTLSLRNQKNNQQAAESNKMLNNQETTGTAMAHLKKCFCTQSLNNQKNYQQKAESTKMLNNQPKLDRSSVGNFLKKCMCTLKFNKVGKQHTQLPAPAVKYEITGNSTRSRRIPQDDIKKPIKTLEPYECEPYVCVPGECNPYECLKLIQRRQVRDSGTDYNRYVKDSATDSMKRPLTKSTKVQYHKKQKIYSKGTSLVSKGTRRSKETAQFLSQPSYNKKRQVVRIGSNFSFNVEFFKDSGGLANNERKGDNEIGAEKVSRIKKSKLKRPKKQRTDSRGSITTIKHLRDRSCQSSTSKKQDIISEANIAPKRCFCTLKLLKKPKHPKPGTVKTLPSTTTKNKMTATKMKYAIPHELGTYECPPFMCIPGECNPYECLEKMKKREIIRKSRNVGTRPTRTSTVSGRSRGLNVKVQKLQAHPAKKRNFTCASNSEPQSEILKSPRIIQNVDKRNKRAVRIGSNFNFNVEFFKQKSQPAFTKVFKARTNEEDSKSYLSKNVTAGARKVRHYNSQMDGAKLKDTASDAGNLLKRCFCTLQLQKPTRQEMGHVNMHKPGNVKYPQTFTIGRVAVDQFHNKFRKGNPSKKTYKVRSTSMNSKLLNRAVGTKTKKTNLRNIEFPSSQCNPSNCPDYQKKSFERKTKNDMQTILPYTPSKFNKKASLTCVSDKKRLKDNNFPYTFNEEGNHKGRNISMLGKGKRRLTAKKSKKSIPTNLMQKNHNIKASFFCRCVRFFSRKFEITNEEENYIGPEKSKNGHQGANLKLVISPKKAKSFDVSCPKSCPEKTNETGKTNFHSKHPQMRVTFADSTKYSKNEIPNRQTNTSVHSKSSTRSRLCYSCSLNDCPIKHKNKKGDKQKSGDHGKSTKNNNKLASYSESADDCQYCDCCKRKIQTDEISKGGGDRRLTISSQYKEGTDACPCGKESFNVKDINVKKNSLRKQSMVSRLSQKYFEKQDKIIKEKPILEMKLDAVNHEIINKRDVKNIFDQISKQRVNSNNIDKQKEVTNYGHIKPKHGNLCTCCKCLEKHKMQGARISVTAKGVTNMRTTFAKLFPKKKKSLANLPKIDPTKQSSKYPRPCTCGSKKCAAELKKIKIQPQKEKHRFNKSCVCGSTICTTESKKLKKKKERIDNRIKRQAQSVKFTRDRKEILKRLKIQEDKDEVRRRKRIKRNKELEAKIKKYKNAGDLMLATDSLLDIGKLGFSTLTGALRYTANAAYDPKVACERICKRCRKTEPETLMKQLEKDYMESDAASTLRRLKTRCLLMNRVQTLKEKLEGNPITHFILHMADKNPKTRQFKRRPVRRVREPLDFQCSLYMATLRKRPYLSVYYKWPWFYPHFITMLNIWRQFTDIMLFLLAAVVWSPCILCMEGCRALMCCFFCTG